MGLEVVAREIAEEGRKEAAVIEKEGLQQAKAVLEEARDKAQRLLEERRVQAEREAERIRQQERARAEFDAKKKVLVAKRALWERLRRETLAALAALPEADRKRVLRRLLERASQDVPEGSVQVRDADTALVAGQSRHRVEGGLSGVGGLVAEDPAGMVSIDLRFESLLEDLWPQVLKEESRRLFGDQRA